MSIGFGELPAIHDMLEARRSGTGLLHEHWGDNVFLETFVDVNVEAALDAPIKVTREIRTARQCMSPLEGRGVVATWDRRLGATAGLHLHPDATYRAHRTGGMSWARAGADSRGGARCRRRLRVQGNPAAGGSLRGMARVVSAIRCAGSRIAANSSPATPTVASTTTISRCTPKRTAR